ncbi:MAG: FtsX-like permease family protein, partial [Bdellovibrio sp.]
PRGKGLGRSRLVQVRGLEAGFPFYGHLQLRERGKLNSEHWVLQSGEVFAYPELLIQLGLEVGDSVQLGEKRFRIADVVVDDSTQSFRLASLAPRVFALRSDLESTALVQKGTTLTESLLVRMPEEKIQIAKDLLKAQLEDPAIQIEDSDEASQDSARALQYLSDYLGLVSLVALFLSALGTLYLFRSYLIKKLPSVAVWNALGLSKSGAQRMDLLQLFFLGLVSSLLCLCFSWLILPVISRILAELTPVSLQLRLSWEVILLALGLGSLGALFICAPLVLPLIRLPTAQLFQESSQLRLPWKWSDWCWFIPALIFFVGLSLWQARSFQVGGLFLVVFVAVAVVLIFFGQLLLWGSRGLSSILSWETSLSLKTLERKRLVSLMMFVSLALGSFLMNFIPQLRAGLRDELEAPSSQLLPSLFLFDIQFEQLPLLKDFLVKRGLSLDRISPLIRARLETVNGKSFERKKSEGVVTREQETEVRFRNRGFNLSYRDNLSDAESLVAGSPFDRSTKIPQISVEQRFANRLGLQLGDLLEFDVQGIPIKGLVWNLRKVKWNTFQPNFFVIFQSGVLEESPQIFLGSVPKMEMEKKEALQAELAVQFPNVSSIDVRRVVERIFDISIQMGWALQVMAVLSLFAGFVVLISMSLDQLQGRIWDFNLLKVLGARESELHHMILFEFMWVGFLAALAGVLLSFVGSFVFTRVVFEGTWVLDWAWPLYSVVGSLVITYLMGRFFTSWIVKSKARELLSASGF